MTKHADALRMKQWNSRYEVESNVHVVQVAQCDSQIAQCIVLSRAKAKMEKRAKMAKAVIALGPVQAREIERLLLGSKLVSFQMNFHDAIESIDILCDFVTSDFVVL